MTPPPINPLLNKKNGFYSGEQTAKDLIGYTDKNEQQRIIHSIHSLNPDNVVSFLKGYHDNIWNESDKSNAWNLGIGASIVNYDFFNQINTEDDFKEKESLMRKVAANLKEHLVKTNNIESATKIEEILNKDSLDKDDVKVLDTIANESVKFGL